MAEGVFVKAKHVLIGREKRSCLAWTLIGQKLL